MFPFGIVSENRIPAPVARYDVNNYNTSDGSNLPQSIVGSSWPTGTLRLSTNNPLTTAAPRYITIYALPPNFPSQTGGVHIGSSNTFRSVEMWVRLTRYSGDAQYFFDFRSGLSDGFTIGGGGGQIGNAMVGTTFYTNTVSGVWSGTSNPLTILSNAGWVQFVQTFSNDIIDSPTLFTRFDSGDAFAFVQGMPLQFADISFYTETLDGREVKALFNQKCSRYSLSPIP